MRISCLLLLCCVLLCEVRAQQFPEKESPYRISWNDGAITAAGIGLSYWGMRLMQQKPGLSPVELAKIDANLDNIRAEIPVFDRWSAGYYSAEANSQSDIPFYTSFALPFLYAAYGPTRNDAPVIGLLYLETMSITGALWTQVNARSFRNRPLVYNNLPQNDARLDRKAENSFFGGHVAATASATFFAAKVFNDYFPDSPARPYVWAGAATLPAAVAWLRIKAGKHFLSDNVVGYVVGAGAGVLVPHLHKRTENIQLAPFGIVLPDGSRSQALGMIYSF